MRKVTVTAAFIAVFFLITGLGVDQRVLSQSQTDASRNAGKAVTIPLSIRIKEAIPEPELQMIDLTVSEDGEPQTVLSIRALATNSPITLAILVQDDLVPPIGNEIKPLAQFVRLLPRGSRVMIGYIRTGSIQIKQKFTTDLEKAASALRPPSGFASTAPYNPYVEVIEAIKKFEAQPVGRRAVLLLSDGLDTSRGIESSSPTNSLDLQRAINEAQRKSIAIYSFYSPTIAAANYPLLAANAQSSLNRLSDETGGRAFFQGTGAPVSLDPFLRELDEHLDRQVALTFLSTHLSKGFHRISVHSSTPGVEVDYPSGYVR